MLYVNKIDLKIYQYTITIQPKSTTTKMSVSLYIPVIQRTINADYVKEVFKTRDIGEVNRVDFVFNKEKHRHEAFVHFERWFDTDTANKFKLSIQDKTIKTKLYYNDKQFWPILVNNNPTQRTFNPKYIDQDKFFEQEKQLEIIKQQLINLEKAYLSQDEFIKRFIKTQPNEEKRVKR